MERYTQPQPRRWSRIIVGSLAGLFVLLLCCWRVVWSVGSPLRDQPIDQVDRVEGRAELLVPSWRIPGGARLSPDSRHMVVGWDGEPIIWNLVTDERRPVPVEMHSMRWLNEQQFVVRSHPDFYIVGAATGQATQVPEVPPETYRKPGGFAVIEPLFQRAEAIYSTQGWGGDRLFVYADNQWSMVVLSAYDFGLANRAELDALLATVPHTPVIRPSNETPAQREQRLTSPDGQYRAHKVGSGGYARAVIETQDGTPVAEIFKAGWNPNILGWAHDSSGIYVQFWIDGSTGAVLVPDKPLFKLSPP